MQNHFLTLQLTDSVAVSVNNSGLIQKLHGRFRVIGIRICQIFISIVQIGRQYGITGSVQTANRNRTHSIIIQSHENSLPERLVRQKSSLGHIHMSQACAYAVCDGNRKAGIRLQIAQVADVGYIFRQIKLTGFQRHGLGRGIAHVHQFDGLERHLPAPVMLIGSHGIAHFLPETGCHIRARSNSGMCIVCGMLRIQDDHNRVSQIFRQVHIRSDRLYCHIAGSIVRRNLGFRLQKFLRSGRTGCPGFEQAFETGCYSLRGQIAAVREFDSISDMEYPLGMFFVDGVLVTEPVDHIHGIVKPEQTLAHAVAGRIPCAVDLAGRIDSAAAVILDTEIHRTPAGSILFSLPGLLVNLIFTAGSGSPLRIRSSVIAGSPAAAGHRTGSQQT